MAEEINSGVAYLAALKKSGTAAAAAPAKYPSEPPAESHLLNPPGDEFKGVEKRRSIRYRCEGSAQIRDESCEVSTWATFTDISVHGCYVEAQATYPAGTILNMKLDANGFRIETKGNVRVSYPYLGMGIAFIDITDDNVTQLKRLLATISHPCMIMGPGIASSLPAVDPLSDLPSITNPEAALRALTEFFENRQMLMRDDFLRIVRKSQSDAPKP
jgi:PilZ domain